MLNRDILSKLKLFTKRISGSTVEFNLTAYQNILSKINSLANEYKNKSDKELLKISQTLKTKARDKENVDDLLIEGFALVREAIVRILKLNPFGVQF
jgi:preprotein translocase subunit SecA